MDHKTRAFVLDAGVSNQENVRVRVGQGAQLIVRFLAYTVNTANPCPPAVSQSSRLTVLSPTFTSTL